MQPKQLNSIKSVYNKVRFHTYYFNYIHFKILVKVCIHHIEQVLNEVLLQSTTTLCFVNLVVKFTQYVFSAKPYLSMNTNKSMNTKKTAPSYSVSGLVITSLIILVITHIDSSFFCLIISQSFFVVCIMVKKHNYVYFKRLVILLQYTQ